MPEKVSRYSRGVLYLLGFLVLHAQLIRLESAGSRQPLNLMLNMTSGTCGNTPIYLHSGAHTNPLRGVASLDLVSRGEGSGNGVQNSASLLDTGGYGSKRVCHS